MVGLGAIIPFMAVILQAFIPESPRFVPAAYHSPLPASPTTLSRPTFLLSLRPFPPSPPPVNLSAVL